MSVALLGWSWTKLVSCPTFLRKLNPHHHTLPNQNIFKKKKNTKKHKKKKDKEFPPWSHLKTSWPERRSCTFQSGIQYKDRDHVFSSHPNSHHFFLFFFLLRLTILQISLYFFDWSLRLFLIFRSKFLHRFMCTKFSGIFKFSFGEDLFWIQNFLLVLLEKHCSGLRFPDIVLYTWVPIVPKHMAWFQEWLIAIFFYFTIFFEYLEFIVKNWENRILSISIKIEIIHFTLKILFLRFDCK